MNRDFHDHCYFVNCERTVLFSVKRDLDLPFTTLDHGLLENGYVINCVLFKRRFNHVFPSYDRFRNNRKRDE